MQNSNLKVSYLFHLCMTANMHHIIMIIIIIILFVSLCN